MMKRALDILAAGAGLVVLLPLLVVVALLVKLDSRGPVFFRQERVGRGFQPFFICKIRTMILEASRAGGLITVGDDPRITRVGRCLRRLKIDELPQLWNVFVGDMSLVGPRPEVPKYVEMFRKDYEEILRVRPGITDLASLCYRSEADVLARYPDPSEAYRSQILPEKIRLAKEYLKRSSFVYDLKLIGMTLRKVWLP